MANQHTKRRGSGPLEAKVEKPPRKRGPKKKSGIKSMPFEVDPTGGPVYTRRLPVALTPDEISSLAVESGTLDETIKAEEASMKARRSAERKALNEKKKKLGVLLHDQKRLASDRDVKVQDVPKYNRKKVVTVRLDTSEEVDERDIRFNELQGKFKAAGLSSVDPPKAEASEEAEPAADRDDEQPEGDDEEVAEGDAA